ncbi:MAG: type II toxin-antitoxin system VapC family toxin [Gaiellaceae bacterium MAG52_C11]|nr:type II toxin-antitoxin system VapC family toxin [Candidatus Gaiellasilicea maunaloa]
MSDGVLVDSNVLIDILSSDERWLAWSGAALGTYADETWLAIDQIVYAELSVHFERREELDEAVPESQYARLALPWEAAFLAGKCFLAYRRAGGSRRSPLPDLYIGAHAAVAGMRLLTRDATRYRTYFPKLELIAPSAAHDDPPRGHGR